MGPSNFPAGQGVNVKPHPHIGLSTLTYLFDGSILHRDSLGNNLEIFPGDVNWMTAGSGIVHSEMPTEKGITDGGVMHGFQIWVNLPSYKKMTPPRYQEIPRNEIPEAISEDGLTTVKVIAGEALGVKAGIDTYTPIVFQDWELKPGAQVITTIPEDFNVGVYLFSGSVQVGSKLKVVNNGQFAVLEKGVDVKFTIPESAKEGARFLLLGGTPNNEPVARSGPFVMNTEAELRQAYQDFRNGKMGTIQR